jgi:hypothetical protein
MHIFNSSGSPVVDMEALAGYARDILCGIRVTCYGDLIAYCQAQCAPAGVEHLKEELAAALSGARVTDPTKAERTENLPSAVIEYERRMLEREPPRPVGVLYDGFDLCAAYNMLLSHAGITLDGLVLVVTNQLFGTFEENECRYHARVIILGHPCIISTSGLVEAPARPREYYLGKQLGLDRLSGEQGIPEKWLSLNDPRTTEVMKGYLAQAVFCHVTGEPFCEERGCRLFNAHWQEDMLFSQLNGEREFCEHHEQLLRTFTGATDG